MSNKVSKTTKSEKWFGKKKQDLTKDELLEYWRLDERHKKLLKKDREIEKYKIVYVNTNNRLIEKDKQILILEKALELMAKSVWSDGTSCMKFLDTGIQVNSQVEYLEYFKTKAKEMMKSE